MMDYIRKSTVTATLLIFLSSCTGTVESAADDNDGRMMMTMTMTLPEFPSGRYRPYGQVPIFVSFPAVALGYNETNWNEVGTNPTETETYSSLQDVPTKAGSLNFMGFSEPVWDCWINHYVGYTWAELALAGDGYHQEAANVLGWTETTWNEMVLANADIASADDMYVPTGLVWPNDMLDKSWTTLSVQEREAASLFCYTTQDLWERTSLNEWEPSLVPTESPTDAPSDLSDRDGGGTTEEGGATDGTIDDPTAAEHCLGGMATCTSSTECCSTICLLDVDADTGERLSTGKCRKDPSSVPSSSLARQRLGFLGSEQRTSTIGGAAGAYYRNEHNIENGGGGDGTVPLP